MKHELFRMMEPHFQRSSLPVLVMRVHLGGSREKPALALVLVAQVGQPEAAVAEIIPALYGFEQMAGDEGLRTVAGVIDAGPVAQEPLI